MENQFRELEVYIGPFKEWKGAKLDKKQSIRLISNGNKDTLKISANIHKSAASFWHTCTLQIYNLSQLSPFAESLDRDISNILPFEYKIINKKRHECILKQKGICDYSIANVTDNLYSTLRNLITLFYLILYHHLLV